MLYICSDDLNLNELLEKELNVVFVHISFFCKIYLSNWKFNRPNFGVSDTNPCIDSFKFDLSKIINFIILFIKIRNLK